MRMGLISDIHANLPALQAILADAQQQGVSGIWNLGDCIGYNPFPEEVLQILRTTPDIQSIVGNYDLNVLAFAKHRSQWQKIKSPAKFFSFEWTAQHISPQSRKFLTALPKQLRMNVAGIRLLLVHGSPAIIDESLVPETPRERFKKLAQLAKADVILFGHSHRYFVIDIDGARFVNPGSVGRPFDGDPRASYAILDFEKGELQITNRRIDYDLERDIQEMKKQGFPEELMTSIMLGKSLDDLPSQQNKYDPVSFIEKVLELAQRYHYEQAHAHQVAKVSLLLFDQLQELHQLGERERLLLQGSALLHDIGWIKGRAGHHKTSRDLILQAKDLPLSERDKLLVALTVRYHRRALPQDTHKYYGDLNPREKEIVNKLASFLRIADGLDIRHSNAAQNLEAQVVGDELILKITGMDFSEDEKLTVREKAALFETIFQKTVILQWPSREETF